ncbi:MAG: hypothetical protein WCW44_03695 [archaeon]|jgi:hypothetical protein
MIKIPKKRLQKEEPKKIIYIAGIILQLFLLMLFGCTELTSSEKGLCYSLSTKSYTTIPACETEDSCFSKVNDLFKTNLSYSQESKLFELKNNVARSWLFFNKANAKIKNAGKICQGKDYSDLPGELNEAEVYLEDSFISLDDAMKQTFEFVNAEEKYLTEQQVDSIKEEKVYDSLIELRQIITELNTGPTNSDSYVSFYLNKTQTFSNSNITKGIPPLIEKQPIATGAYEYVQGSILEKMGATTLFWFPTLNSAYENGLGYLESLLYSTQGISALKKFPVSEFTALYSSLGGKDTSSLKRFIDLANKTSANLESTQKSIDLLWKENDSLLNECKTELSTLEEYSSFDELYSSLLGTTAVNETETTTKIDIKLNEILALREKKSKNILSLGEEISKLKQYSIELKEIKLMLTIEKENYDSKLAGACDALAKTTKEEELQSEELTKLIYDSRFDASKTISTKGKEKLMYCSKLNKDLKLLETAKKDYLSFEAERKDSAKDCFLYLEKIFNSVELNELKNAFDELSKTQVTKENLEEFVYSCEVIKQQTDYILREDNEVLSCEKEINYARKKLPLLFQVAAYENSSKASASTQTYSARLKEYETYFETEGPSLKARLDLLLPIKSNLFEKLKTLNKDINQTLKEGIISYAQNNLQITQLNDFVAESSKDYNSTLRLTLPNPFEKITGEILIPVKIKPSTISQNDCITNITSDKNYSTLLLSCLPLGGISVDFTQQENLGSEEVDELIFVSNKESLIKRTITLTNTSTIKKALIFTNLPKGITKVVAINKSKELLTQIENQSLTFYLENLQPNEETTLFFYIEDLINVRTQIEQKINGAETEKIVYLISAQNTLSKKVSANLLLDIPINSNVEEIVIIKNGTELITGKIQANNLLLSNQIFEEKQEINYKIQLTVNNSLQYYLEELEKQREELIGLGETTSAKLLADLISLGEKNSIKTLQAKYLETTTLLKKLNLEKEEKLSQALLKQNILDKIEELRTQIEELNRLGLSKESKEIETLIQEVLNLDLDKQTNLTKAFDLLSKKTFSFDDTLKENAEGLLKKVEELTKNTSFEELLTLKEKFMEEKQNFEQVFPFDPTKGNTYYQDLQSTFNSIVRVKEDLDANQLKTAKENQKEINKLKQINLKLISELEEYFTKTAGASKNKFIPPITQNRLAKLKLDLIDLNTMNSSSEEILNNLSKMQEELSNAKEYLKREAIILFNKGIDASLSTDTLTKAKEYLDENNYADALFLLSNNPSVNQPLLNFNYLIFLPIILILVAAFALKRSFGKKERTDTEKKKLILEEWKE